VSVAPYITPPPLEAGAGRKSREEPRAGSRYAQLDGLRGIAASAVLFFHYFGIFPDVFETEYAPIPHANLGAYGVQLFFVVSGFVILMTVGRARRPSDFAIGRFTRLFPTYWAAVLLTAAIISTGVFPDTGVTQHELGLRQFAANMTMLQSFLNEGHLDGVYWTLAYELSFYAWAFILLVAGQLHRVEAYAGFYLVFQIAAHAALQSGLLHVGGRLQTLLLLDYGHFFVAGMMFYRLRAEGKSPARHALIALACLAQAVRGEVGPTLVLVAIVAVFYALHAGRLRWLGARPLVFLGTISYALYATHEMPGWALMRVLRGLGVNYWLAWAITVPAAIVVAWLITRFVEQPGMAALKGYLNQLRDRWKPALASTERVP
jgi:peptidoglycan/LPS O-acetylase OafA/YrhL